MASFTRTHGDFKPVLNLDTGSYTSGAINLPTSAATVNPAGPKLDFFTVTLANVATDGTVAKTSYRCNPRQSYYCYHGIH